MVRLSMRKVTALSVFILVVLVKCATAYSLVGGIGRSSSGTSIRQSSSLLRQSIVTEIVDAIEDIEMEKQRELLKRTILQMGASYDRGFAASPRARKKMDDILRN